jgi:hypothetical protein
MSNSTSSAEGAAVLSQSHARKLKRLGLLYNQPEPAIICKECCFAINPKRTPRHPGDKHDVSKSTRRGLKALICSLSLPDPENLPLRPDGSEPHPHLATQRGSACKHCGLRSTSDRVLVAHIRTEHKDKIKLAARQKHYWLRDHIQEGLLFQSWAAKDVRRSWIIISGGSPGQGVFIREGSPAS